MANTELTEIAVVLDRSGSMEAICEDMKGGFDRFIAEQRALPGRCMVSLYQFDHEFQTVYQGWPINDVPPLQLVPRARTALLDALGRTIAMVGERLAAKAEDDRPGKVIVLVITDGRENASREYTRKLVTERIAHQRERYNWQFAFLGADLEGVQEAVEMGMSHSAVQGYVATPQGVKSMYSNVSRAVGSYRSDNAVGSMLKLEKDDDAGGDVPKGTDASGAQRADRKRSTDSSKRGHHPK